jgi:hypothetical protein
MTKITLHTVYSREASVTTMVTGEECYLKRVYRKFSQKCFRKFKKYLTQSEFPVKQEYDFQKLSTASPPPPLVF